MQWFGKDQIPITKIVMLQNEINNIANFEATDVKVYDFRAVWKFENSKIFVCWMAKFAIPASFFLH